MRNQKTEGIEIALTKLIPFSNIKSTLSKLTSFIENYNYRGDSEKNSGFINNDNEFIIWFKIANDKVQIISISRYPIRLTSNEINILKQVPEIIDIYDDSIENEFYKSNIRLASKLSFETLLIAKYLRKIHEKRYSVIANIIFALKDLTYERYEQTKCTSGFVFSNKIERYISKIPSEEYQYVKFEQAIELGHSFFATPATFRYVDGKNSFYLIDNFMTIHGIIYIKNPKKYNIVDRLNNKHIENLINEQISTRRWLAYVGINDDVNILMPHQTSLKWSKNHWSIRERSILEGIFQEFEIIQEVSTILIDTIFAMSELRQGTVILIPNTINDLPTISGEIDQSKVGINLRKLILKSEIELLNKTHSLLGILSSDGLTTITKNGQIIGCGQIISIDNNLNQINSGGGRSQAALSASVYGMSIKVSEDGPISIFKNREKIMFFN